MDLADDGPAGDRLHGHLRAGDRAAAAARLPFDLIDATSLVGSVDRVASRMADYAAAGVTTLGIMVSAAATTLEGRLAIVDQAALALERSGRA